MTPFIQNLLQVSISMAAVLAVVLLLVPLWQQRWSAFSCKAQRKEKMQKINDWGTVFCYTFIVKRDRLR